MTGSTISSTSAAITSQPANIGPPEPRPSRPGPRSPAWPLRHKPSCDRPSCALSRPEPIKLTVPSVVVPPIEIAVDRAAREQVLRDLPPLATRAEPVHQAVDDLAHIARALVAARLRGRDQGSNERPLLVGHVTWVAKLAPVVASAVLIGPHRQPQSPAAHRSTSRSDRSTCSRTDTQSSQARSD